MTGSGKFFDRAYGLGDDPEKTRDLYKDWAESYDKEVKEQGYASPARTAAAMAANVADLSAPLLDIGCGTGLSAEALKEAGFTTIDGTDFSEEMLAAAGTKGFYRKLTKGDFNDPIPAKPGDYANITAIGVFSPGHGPAGMIDTVMGLLGPGGCFGFSLNDHALEDPSYEETIARVQREGIADLVFSEYGDHLPGLGLKSKICVLRKK